MWVRDNSLGARAGQQDRERYPVSRLVSPGVKDRSTQFYSITESGRAIVCHLCGCVSHDSHDIEEKYCPRCRVFHEDRLLMLRLAEGYQASYHSASETTSLPHAG